MKILLSPSKTQNITNHYNVTLTQPLFINQTKQLIGKINQWSDEGICQKLHVPKTQQDKVVTMYRQFGKKVGSAFESYTGEAFKYLKKDLQKEELDTMQGHLYIFSALYGLLRPFDMIAEYRLDMTMSVLENQSLTQFWKDEIENKLVEEELILSLASKEFEKVITIPYYRVEFFKADGTRVHTVLAKQMRGMMAHHIIKHCLFSIAEIRMLKLNGFYCKEEESRTLKFYLEK